MFSDNTIEFKTMNTTRIQHFRGEIISYQEQLIAIGGFNTAMVEVHQNGIWNKNVIPMVGNSNPISAFSTLSTKDGLYVFGKYNILTSGRAMPLLWQLSEVNGCEIETRFCD